MILLHKKSEIASKGKNDIKMKLTREIINKLEEKTDRFVYTHEGV